MASASYVTGSHAIKVGMTDGWGENSRTFAPNANINTLIKINARRAGQRRISRSRSWSTTRRRPRSRTSTATSAATSRTRGR